MSRTNQTETMPNPAGKFISLSGKTGKFNYWDKNKKKNVDLEYPIVFLPLDVLMSITGFNQKWQSGYYSNEVHNLSTEILNVKIFKQGEFVSGLYADIKEKIAAKNGKFTNSVYAIMYDEDKTPEMVNFQFHGISLSAFIEYKKEAGNIYKKATSITGTKPAKKGNTNYFIPIFAPRNISQKSSDTADEFDKELQEYLHKRKNTRLSDEQGKVESENKQVENTLTPPIDSYSDEAYYSSKGGDDTNNSFDDLPF